MEPPYKLWWNNMAMIELLDVNSPSIPESNIEANVPLFVILKYKISIQQ